MDDENENMDDDENHSMEDDENHSMDDYENTEGVLVSAIDLFQAAEIGSAERINSILADPVNLMTDNYGNTALHKAVEYGQIEAVNALLEHGANPNLQNHHGLTALHNACLSYQGDEDVSPRPAVIERLLQYPNINIEIPADLFPGTALSLALYENEHDCARKLMQQGASVTNIDDNHSNALHSAAKNVNDDDEAFLPLLKEICLRKDIDINQKDDKGNTALMYLCSQPCNKNILAALELLVSSGAQVELKDKKGNTALHRLCMEADTEIFDNPKEIEMGPECGWCYPEDATEENRLNARLAVDVLVRNSPSPDIFLNASNERGLTPLYLSVIHGVTHCTVHLLQYKSIALNKRTSLVSSAVGNLSYKKDWGFANEADVFHWEVIRALIKAGTDINTQDDHGNTPLHLACMHLHNSDEWELVEELLEQENISFHTMNKRGFTPIIAAARSDAPVDFLFKLISHTPTILDSPPQNFKDDNKRSHSAAFL